jgi:hypothetical protein
LFLKEKKPDQDGTAFFDERAVNLNEPEFVIAFRDHINFFYFGKISDTGVCSSDLAISVSLM